MPAVDTPLACEQRRDDFDHPGDAGSLLARELARLCRACPVLQACGEWALTVDVEGFAAGMTVRERRQLKRKAAA